MSIASGKPSGYYLEPRTLLLNSV